MAKSITSIGVKYPFKEPFISKPDDDKLTKQWVVEYGIWSEREQKIKRKHVVLAGSTVTERIADGGKVIAELKKTLKSGVCVDPLAKEPEPAVDIDKVVPATSLRKAIAGRRAAAVIRAVHVLYVPASAAGTAAAPGSGSAR